MSNVDSNVIKSSQNQRARLLRILNETPFVTSSQIAKRMRISVSRARYLVNELRRSGYAVYSQRATLTNGKVKTQYTLGYPSREMVALAFEIKGASLFT